MRPEPPRVRSVEPHDRDAWAAMRAALWPKADESELRRECADFFERPTLIEAVLVAEAAGDLLGFVELSLRSIAYGCLGSPVPYIEGWYVHPEARRKGVGRELIAAAERWATGLGFDEIASDVALGNGASETAHKSLGFQEVGRAIHFRKTLTPSGKPSTP